MSARPFVHVRGKRVLRRTRTNNEAGDALRQTTEVHELSYWLFDFTRASCSPPLFSSLSPLSSYLSTCFTEVHRSSALRNLAASFGSTGSSTSYRSVSWNRVTEEKRRVKFNFVRIWSSKVGTRFCALEIDAVFLISLYVFNFGIVSASSERVKSLP